MTVFSAFVVFPYQKVESLLEEVLYAKVHLFWHCSQCDFVLCPNNCRRQRAGCCEANCLETFQVNCRLFNPWHRSLWYYYCCMYEINVDQYFLKLLLVTHPQTKIWMSVLLPLQPAGGRTLSLPCIAWALPCILSFKNEFLWWLQLPLLLVRKSAGKNRRCGTVHSWRLRCGTLEAVKHMYVCNRLLFGLGGTIILVFNRAPCRDTFETSVR